MKDFKYDIMKHPRVSLTSDGNGKPYIHGEVDAVTLNFDYLGVSEAAEQEDPQGESSVELYTQDDIDELISKLPKKEVTNLEEERQAGTEQVQ